MGLGRVIPRAIWAGLLVLHGPIFLTVVASLTTQLASTGRCEAGQAISAVALLASMVFFGLAAAGLRVLPRAGTTRHLLVAVVAAGVFHHETILEADARVLMPLAVTTVVTGVVVTSRPLRGGPSIWQSLHTVLAAASTRPMLLTNSAWRAPTLAALAETSGGPVRRGRAPPHS